MPPVAFAIAACCGCAPFPKPVRRILSLTEERLPPGAELGIGTLERDNGAHLARILWVGLPREKGECSMKSFLKSWALAAILTAALASVLAPHAAAQTGSISGTVLDLSGKPYSDVGIQAVNEQGAKQDAKTDSNGKYNIQGLRPGIYTVTVVAFPPPNDKQQPYPIGRVQVQNGEEAKMDVNFKEVLAKQGAAVQEQAKKAEEAKVKLEGLKVHFNAGNALIDQEKQVK